MSEIRKIRKGAARMGMSLIHQDVYNCRPKKDNLWWWAPHAYPASFQTKAGKKMRKLIVQKLKSSEQTKKTCENIGNKPLQILIKYMLVNTLKKRDIDNYTKNIIDSLKEGGLFKDDTHHQVRFVASKINYLSNIGDKRFYRANEKAIITVNFFDENQGIIKKFNEEFGR